MKLSDLLRVVRPRPAVRKDDPGPSYAAERLPRVPRVVRWAWASAVTTGIVMALASGQSVSRQEVLQLLKAVTALVEEEQPTRAKEQPAPPELQGPALFIPDPKWGR